MDTSQIVASPMVKPLCHQIEQDERSALQPSASGSKGRLHSRRYDGLMGDR
jgi:hypothetical protein